ncbi:unnamed protein product [Ceutorhynchus assimilis]|uniref:Uncharacterized protein n=1 Tax=Ceutorhynchus assimilis TaxID=467358 RepID=A0A9N9MYH1_9CUCU|nr:unnamed protein product [Ceutorhynchus assimilis]
MDSPTLQLLSTEELMDELAAAINDTTETKASGAETILLREDSIETQPVPQNGLTKIPETGSPENPTEDIQRLNIPVDDLTKAESFPRSMGMENNTPYEWTESDIINSNPTTMPHFLPVSQGLCWRSADRICEDSSTEEERDEVIKHQTKRKRNANKSTYNDSNYEFFNNNNNPGTSKLQPEIERDEDLEDTSSEVEIESEKTIVASDQALDGAFEVLIPHSQLSTEFEKFEEKLYEFLKKLETNIDLKFAEVAVKLDHIDERLRQCELPPEKDDTNMSLLTNYSWTGLSRTSAAKEPFNKLGNILEEDENDPYSDSGSEYAPENEDMHENSSDSEYPEDDDVEKVEIDNNVIENEDGNNNETPKSPNRGRKRKRNPSTWKRVVNSANRSTGKAYVNRSGRNVSEKKFKNADCQCARRCSTNVRPEERKIMFDSFYKLGDNTKQNINLRGLIQNSPIKQRRSRNSSRPPKSKTIKYFLTTSTKSTRVCKIFFIDTFQVSDARIYKISCQSEPSACIDKRGHKEPSNKIDITNVKEHIQSFPCYKSHYALADAPNRRYLNPDLNIRKMFVLYEQKCEQEGSQAVKEKMYYHVFSTHFNLHFKPPAKDTCQLCDNLQNVITFEKDEAKKNTAIIEKEVHLRKAQLARSCLNNDKLSADENVYVLTFDLEKALPFPKLSTSVAYYKVNMYVYNFGIHTFNNNKGYMFMWDETEGSRGSQEIASCLVRHLKEEASNFNHIVMYSDCCTGQNRNIKLSLSLLKLTQDPVMSTSFIDHKFLVSGHSYLPNDADFGIIESKSRKKEFIYGPRDWFNLVATAKKTNPFQVTEMAREEFVSTKPLEDSICNRKTNTDGGKVNWLNIKWLRYCKNEPNLIFYKETLQDDFPFFKINIARAPGKGRPPNLVNIVQEPLYPNRRPVKPIKKRHMSDLLTYIPPHYHPFYKSLPILNERTRTSTSKQPETAENVSDNNDSDYID